ncbi:MAG: class I SAM-dependent methyltransferase [Clostridia bacterium]|nr:class I SAM-dependent methyltransferase [Clostridia bacterium]
MNGYGSFAAFYDALTDDVDYAAWADYLLAAVTRHGGCADTVLDLACGSGSLSLELAARGCEVIGVDGSADMLAWHGKRRRKRGRTSCSFVRICGSWICTARWIPPSVCWIA